MKQFFLLLCIIAVQASTKAQDDPLPSWNDGPVKTSIINFVKSVTTEGTRTFVPVEDRVATFDNDGTLWAEKPLVQGMFAVYRVKEMVEVNPSLRTKQPYAAVLQRNKSYFARDTEKRIIELVASTHTGMTATEFAKETTDFFNNAEHPTLKTPISKTLYQPQLELLAYLRTNGFTTYICSGGTVDFMRIVSMQYYGIPPQQVIGSEFKYRYVDSAGVNDITRLAGLRSFNDKQEKPVNIQYHIGKRPILACGNEGGAGDVYMLRFCQGNKYPSLQLLVNHDDAQREFYYQEKDNRSLNMARQYGWQVISMQKDWKAVFNK